MSKLKRVVAWVLSYLLIVMFIVGLLVLVSDMHGKPGTELYLRENEAIYKFIIPISLVTSVFFHLLFRIRGDSTPIEEALRKFGNYP